MRRMIIERLPGRKRKALCLEDGCVVRPLAYFVDDAAVEVFLGAHTRYDETRLAEMKFDEEG
jgi:hypothetical protein